MIGEERLRAWRKAAPGFVRRQSKNLRQLRYGFRHRQQLCFVFGCQRSGTKMLMRILDNSPATRIYHENNVLAFDDFQLRSDAILRTLTRSSPAPSQIFKPICDSHKADRLLERFPDANGLWIYRHYDDVANSARQKWGAHQRDVVAAVATGDLAPWGWRTEGISAEVTAEIRRVYRPDLLEDEGALLFWYLRNSFFFALGLDQHPRMLLVKYEELVRDPEHSFPPVFAHVGAPYDPSFLERVHAGSVGRKAPPRASAEIRALCEGLQQRLDAAVRRPPRPVPVVSPVLMLINTLATGGAERYVVTVANWLADQGARVIIAAEHGELVEQLRPSIVFQDTDLRRVRGRLPVVAGRIRELIQREKPAVILGNSLVVTGIARAALPLGGVPVVNVAHGWPADRYRRVAPLMNLAADVVVAVSPDVRTRLLGGGLIPEKCEVILNGVNCEGLGPRSGETRRRVREELGAGPDELLVVTLGRLTPQKAHHHVITIAAQLRDRHPQLRYAIVGEGGRMEELAELIRTNKVEDRVRLMGLRSDAPDLLGSADLYLSCSDWEGLPLSTIEAMAAGLPVVATRTEGSGQLFTEDTGLVVPIGDVPAMTEAIARLAQDPALRAQMGAAARVRALAEFSHQRMCAELAGLLARVAG